MLGLYEICVISFPFSLSVIPCAFALVNESNKTGNNTLIVSHDYTSLYARIAGNVRLMSCEYEMLRVQRAKDVCI